jgi:hypothetical protein
MLSWRCSLLFSPPPPPPASQPLPWSPHPLTSPMPVARVCIVLLSNSTKASYILLHPVPGLHASMPHQYDKRSKNVRGVIRVAACRSCPSSKRHVLIIKPVPSVSVAVFSYKARLWRPAVLRYSLSALFRTSQHIAA